MHETLQLGVHARPLSVDMTEVWVQRLEASRDDMERIVEQRSAVGKRIWTPMCLADPNKALAQ